MLEAAKSRRRSARPPAVSLCRAAAGFLTLGLVLCGCVGHGLESAAPITPDKSLITGSIPESTTETSDRDAVRKAVASAARPSGSVSIPWADPTTGTVGVIISLSQSQSAAGTCRSFATTRHSYEGISLYVGRACKFDGASWRLVEFGPKNVATASATG